MIVYVYATNPIDFWCGWQLVSEACKIPPHIRDLLDPQANLDDDHQNDSQDYISIFDVAKFFEAAKWTARKIGWEGDVAWGPYISMLPHNESDCLFMLAWKQSNNGTTFIASPFDLPWLKGCDLLVYKTDGAP